MIELPAPIEEMIRLSDGRHLRVVRDDLLPGGTKVRILVRLMQGGREYVYASPAEGYAQIALARTADLVGGRATVFVAARAERHPNTAAAAALGAAIHEVRPGYLTVVTKRARDYCVQTGAAALPFGMDTDEARCLIADSAAVLDVPDEVWCVAGSGTLARGLAMAWSTARFHVVQVGRAPSLAAGMTLYKAPEPFERAARLRPPFPSSANYDAKAWRFIEQHASDGALFWNVGG